ncbi:MAG: hypothetical protein QM734_02650 [Cyclobacteriaceae bacterium]
MKLIYFGLLFILLFSCSKETSPQVVVLISANAEWKVVKSLFSKENYQSTPFGENIFKQKSKVKIKRLLSFFHEGWGKTAAAGATQFAIEKWNPEYFINLGTCGGFEGAINRYEVVLVNKTVIYDIKEAMGDSKEAVDDYTTDIDVSWLKVYPSDSVKTTLLVSADKDLVPQEISELEIQRHCRRLGERINCLHMQTQSQKTDYPSWCNRLGKHNQWRSLWWQSGF